MKRTRTGSKSKLKNASKERKEQDKSIHLFQELCKEKSQKKESPAKNSSRKKSVNKENLPHNSFANATRTPLGRFAEQPKTVGSFHGLKKVSKTLKS